MPYSTQWEEKGIYWKYSGTVTHADILNSNDEFYRDERSDNASYQLVDCSKIDCFEILSNTIATVAALDYASSHYLKDLKIALIAKDTETKAIYQQYLDLSQKLHIQWNVELFEDIESARNWINS